MDQDTSDYRDAVWRLREAVGALQRIPDSGSAAMLRDEAEPICGMLCRLLEQHEHRLAARMPSPEEQFREFHRRGGRV
jgi:hypothetical protein